MSTVTAYWRRAKHPAWREAHRSDLPRIRDWLGVIAFLLALSAGWFEVDTWALRVEAKDAIAQNERVLNCLNGKGDLGEYQEVDGTRWVIKCTTFERRVSGHRS